MSEVVNFIFGEKKRVCIEVFNVFDTPFEISKAKFQTLVSDEIEENGDCEITYFNDHAVILSALINPKRKGAIYTLRYSYDIFPESLIYDVRIRVN